MAKKMLPTDAVLVMLVHLGKSQKEIAAEYGVSPQAVSKKLRSMGLYKRPFAREANSILRARWGKIWSPKEGTGHHNSHDAKALKAWLRRRLGDDTLSPAQISLAERWEQRLREEGTVLCYDREQGWYYRPRSPEDGGRVIDWPPHIPYPSDEAKEALELPPEPVCNA